MFATYGIVVYEAGRKSSDMLAVAILVLMVGLVPKVIPSLSNVHRPKLANNMPAHWRIRDASKVVAFISIWTVVAVEYIWHAWSDSTRLALTAPISATVFATTASIQLLYATLSATGDPPPHTVSPSLFIPMDAPPLATDTAGVVF
jgi:hypothetical protein